VGFFDVFKPKAKRSTGYTETDGSGNVIKRDPTPDPRVIEILSSKTEDLVRNDANACRAVKVYASNIVGAGILPQTVSISGNEQLKDVAEAAWKKWADTTACDADGVSNLYGVQTRVARELVVSGNCFIRRRKRALNNEGILPFQLQVLSYDYLATDFHDTDLRIINGIKYDKKNKVVSYFFYKENPNAGNTFFGFNTSMFLNETVEIKAEDVCHVYEADRAGQRQGVSWFAPVLGTLKDLNLFMYARLVQQQNQAAFSGFVETDADDLSALGADKDDTINLKAGTYQRLDPGDRVIHQNNSDTSDDSEMIDVYMRNIARGLGMDYLEFSGKYSDTNYSSSRMSWISFSRNVKAWQSQIMEAQFLSKVGAWANSSMVYAGIIPVSQKDDLFTKWVSPRREMLDTAKESSALIDMIDNRLISRKHAIESMGRDYNDVMNEVELDNARQKEIGPDAMEIQQIAVVEESGETVEE